LLYRSRFLRYQLGMNPWERLAIAEAPDGIVLELRRRAQEYLIIAGGYDLMSSRDERSSRSLGELGCRHLASAGKPRVLIGGLGMGFTASATLEHLGPEARVDIAELVESLVDWNRDILGDLAGHPLKDPRVTLHVTAVQNMIRKPSKPYDAILLDVDNGPDSLAHDENSELYSATGIDEAWLALVPGGVLGVWSISDDAPFTKRLTRRGFEVSTHRVEGSRSGRGRHHWIWTARRPTSG